MGQRGSDMGLGCKFGQMAPNIGACGSIIKLKEKALFRMQMEMNTKVNLGMTNLTGTGCTNVQMARFMRAYGSTTFSTVKDRPSGQIRAVTMAIMNKESEVGRANTNGPTGMCTRVSGQPMPWMDLARTSGPMAESTKAIGRGTLWRVRESTRGQTDANMTVTTKQIKRMAKDVSTGQTGVSTRAAG